MTETIDTSTGPIAYDLRHAAPGSPELPPLVLLPSGGHDHHDFDELRSRLPEMTTIAVDWPAQGDSPPLAAGPASAMRLADLAEELIAKLAPGGAIVAGNSVGSFAAGRLAVRRPELVRGLALIDGGGFSGRSPASRLFCALMARPRFLRAIYPGFTAAYMRARTDADMRARATALASTRSDASLRALSELWGSFASPDHDLRGVAGEIAAPTLLLWGRRDPVIPPRVGRRVQRLIPGSRLVVLDTGHVPHTSDPDGAAAALRELAGEVAAKHAQVAA
jgi:pimeloyl-ACP methyl ester carboxylesterase